MSQQDTRLTALGEALWGFCDACEGWILSGEWCRDGQSARCPRCGTRPSALEEWEGMSTRVAIMFELPPGAVEPLI